MIDYYNDYYFQFESPFNSNSTATLFHHIRIPRCLWTVVISLTSSTQHTDVICENVSTKTVKHFFTYTQNRAIFKHLPLCTNQSCQFANQKQSLCKEYKSEVKRIFCFLRGMFQMKEGGHFCRNSWYWRRIFTIVAINHDWSESR